MGEEKAKLGGSLGATAPPPARTPLASCAAAVEKGRAWRSTAVAEEGRDGEAGGGVGAVRRHTKKAERSLAPEETPTW